MNNNINSNNNSIYITFSNNALIDLDFFDVNNNIKTVAVKSKGKKTVIAVNNNFYSNNALYVINFLIEEINKFEPSTIVFNSSEFFNSVLINGLKPNKTNLYFTKECEFNISDVLSIKGKQNIRGLIFENDISVDVANALHKNNISFSTLGKYNLLNLNKISGDNPLYSFSDYYSLYKLNINKKLNNGELKNLEQFFSFNKNLVEINLKCNLKNALKIIQLYVNNKSQYSHATFNINMPKIAVSSVDNSYLYEINKILTKNNCKLKLTFNNKEHVSYKNYVETITPIKKYANKINKLNLSTLEKLVLIEDYVKVKPYNDSKNKNEARNLFSSLNSEYVVCFTYALTFKCLCDLCHIPATITTSRLNFTNNKVSEHAKIICRVEDEKYNFNSLLLFEPTYDAYDTKTFFDEEKPTDNFLFFGHTLKQTEGYYNSKPTEFGLLKIAREKVISAKSVEQNTEACRQINELYGTHFTAYSKNTLNEDFRVVLKHTIKELNSATPLTLETFKSAITQARQSVETFTDSDFDRIYNINSYKAATEISDSSDVMFVDKDLYSTKDLTDDEILTFESLLDDLDSTEL